MLVIVLIVNTFITLHFNIIFTLLHSHWTRNVEAWLSLVERIIVLLCQLSYAIKNELVLDSIIELAEQHDENISVL